MRFKNYIENTDIFGFDKDNYREEPDDNMLSKPINKFDIELMMELLSNKSINEVFAYCPFVNEIRWGNQPGSVKLEIDTGLTFHIKKLVTDLQGNPRWITKRMLQLNRQGYGGLEDAVSQEIYEHLKNYSEGIIEAPKNDYDGLESLVQHLFNKTKRTCKEIFLPEGIKKLNDDAFIIKYGVRGQGVQAPDQRRVEQNQTLIAYDREQGVIRITNYNVTSSVGGRHDWSLGENDLDLYFMPTQDREEISECLAVHLKYY